MQSTGEGLKREIGVWGLVSNIINVVVGAGIFVLPAIVAGNLGSASILAYLFCGLLIILIMLCFAEVGSQMTHSGGAYSYIEESFGKYPGFITTNLFIFGASILADAAVANALADTLSYLTPIFEQKFFRTIFFVFIFSGLAIINIRGVKQGITLVKITTIAKLTPLMLLVLFGWTKASAGNLAWTSTPSIQELGEISLILFFAFQGAETALNVSGEIRNPQKTIPRGILISIFTVLSLYILIQLTAQGVLGESLSEYRDAPLAEVAKHVFGPFGVTLMLVGAAISMFGNLSGEILNLPRVVFRASMDRVIPPMALSKIHNKFATPYIAIIAYAALGCSIAIAGEFKQLAILASSSMLLIYLGVALSLIKIRMQKKSPTGYFRIPGGYLVPILAIVTIIWFLSNLSVKEQIGIVLFIAFLTIVFFVMKFLKKED